MSRGWFSGALRRTKRVDLVLPPDYSIGRRRYPVLVLLHGYGGNRQTWLRNTGLVRDVRPLGLIVVLPESGRRWFVNDHQGYRYEDYLVHELVPLVDRHFRTVADRTARAIAGFSMGGAAAVFQALRHPATFSVAASLGGAFAAPLREGDPYATDRRDPAMLMPTVEVHERVWGPPGSQTRRTYRPDELLDRYDPEAPIALHVEVGADDYPRMVRMNREMHRALLARRIVHGYRERPGGHDWAFVADGLPDVVRFVRHHLSPPLAAGGDPL